MAMSWKTMRNVLDRDALLERVGLEKRTPTGDFFTGLGLFSVGVLVGAGLGLIFAPKRGDEMRAMLNDAWKSRARAPEEFAHEIGGEGVPPGVAGH